VRRLISVPGLRWRGRVKEFEREVYDHWAEGIDRSIWAPWLRRWVERFAGEIPEARAVLDIGCGTGTALRLLARYTVAQNCNFPSERNRPSPRPRDRETP
jgi:SAM-dependent methyltransferase